MARSMPWGNLSTVVTTRNTSLVWHVTYKDGSSPFAATTKLVDRTGIEHTRYRRPDQPTDNIFRDPKLCRAICERVRRCIHPKNDLEATASLPKPVLTIIYHHRANSEPCDPGVKETTFTQVWWSPLSWRSMSFFVNLFLLFIILYEIFAFRYYVYYLR